MLILLSGLAAAQLLSFGLALVERSMASRGMMVNYLASDVASSVAMLERLPPQERSGWLPRLARRHYSFALASAGGWPPSRSAFAEPVVQELGQLLRRPVRAVDAPDGTVHIGLQLDDGTPVTVHLTEPRLRVSAWAWGVLAAQLALVAGICWLTVRLVTRPLRELADAADGFQPAGAGAPLPEHGPREVARAAAAFNTMRTRIRAHLDERMRILAAVSHDLQTPITRLRLRADLLEDGTLRDKLHADLAEMQALVEEGIAFARSAHAVQERARDVDLGAFLDSIVLDYVDAGRPVRLTSHAAAFIKTRPQSLRRLVCNLVDNALNFAGDAEVTLAPRDDGWWVMHVLDRGPGIPDDQLEAVLEPFHRVESSRSRQSGGTGLGLAIAKQLADALGGRLTLAAREGGGLAVRLDLPALRGP